MRRRYYVSALEKGRMDFVSNETLLTRFIYDNSNEDLLRFISAVGLIFKRGSNSGSGMVNISRKRIWIISIYNDYIRIVDRYGNPVLSVSIDDARYFSFYLNKFMDAEDEFREYYYQKMKEIICD